MATSRADTARAAVDLTFEELYRGLRGDVYRAALRKLGNPQDAEDVTQAAFADAYRAVLRGARPESPRAWLLAISENVRRRRFRTAQRRPREELVDDADFPTTAELPYERSRVLSEALATLPPEQRRIFVLREIVGLSYAEIAEELDSTVGSVQMLLFRARRSLRDVLDPPTVAVRRPIFLPPLPGWIAGLWSRVELAALAPRAAGTLGAAVLTVGGASVAVPVSQADGLRPVPVVAAPSAAPAEPTAAPAERTAAGRITAAPPARAAKPAALPARTVVRAAPPPTPTVPPRPRSQPAAVPSPIPRTVPEAGTAPASDADQPQPPPSLPGVVGTVEAVVEQAAGPPLPQVSLPVPPPSSSPLPLPAPPASPALADVVETATGAAGAAGASAPPVPVPAVPVPALPPAP